MDRTLVDSRGARFALLVAFGALVACAHGNEIGGGDSADSGSGGDGAGGSTAGGSSARAGGGSTSGGSSSSGGRIGGGGSSGSRGGAGAAGTMSQARGGSGTGTGGGSGAGTGGGSGVGTGGGSGVGTGGTPTSLPPPDPSCGLPDAAFCDAFTKASPGGRAGDLDDAHWSMSRLGFGCAYHFAFAETPINLCGVWKTVEPNGSDSQFCVNENNEPRWTEGFDDNADFNYLSARVRQPFDFQGRTGTIQWEADARTSGSHGWWTETWITADPVPGVNLHDPDQLVTSKEALGISFDLNCGAPQVKGGTAGSGMVGVSRILRVHDYKVTHTYDPFVGPEANRRCVKTEQNAMNLFHVKLSQNRVEVWASDAGSKDLKRIAEADIDLGFTRGYVHLSHVHYNAQKAEVTTFQSYQWAHVAFDGPQLQVPRAYEIADPLTRVHTNCFNRDAYRIAYGVTNDVVYDIGTGVGTPLTLKFTNVDPTNGVAARLNFNTTYVAPGDTLRYRVNGKDWHTYQMPAAYVTYYVRQGFSVPVPVSDLAAGDNTVEFGTNSNPGMVVPPNSMQIANIDLEIEAP